MPKVPPSDSYYCHHSPFGAYATFTLGRYGHGGGFALESGKIPDQNVFIAYSRPGEPVRALPFYKGSISGPGAFTGESAAVEDPFTKAGWEPFKPEEITRTLKWATDTWEAGNLKFTIYTPVRSLDPAEECMVQEVKDAVCPAIGAELVFDNSRSTTAGWAFFGIGNAGQPLRLLTEDTSIFVPGFACGTEWGFAYRLCSDPIPKVVPVQSWELPQLVKEGKWHVHRLAADGGFLIRAAAGQRVAVMIALGFYRGGIATTGVTTNYHYAPLFDGLDDVLESALNCNVWGRLARSHDDELESSGLSPARQFLVSLATRSYYGNTQLLRCGGKPLWVVNEGEYCMMNTFDLTVDHAFFELAHHPWTLRNALDLFVERYSYMDELHERGRNRTHPGGIAFTHDMGTHNQFTPPGWSSYEQTNLDGCFSHMTHEQLVNWVCCGAMYGVLGQDDYWLRQREPIFLACLESLIRRDAPPGGKRDGVMQLDSSRCGTGQEITTYDSLDASLGQARNNLYLAVKTWAAYVCLGHVFERLKRPAAAQQALAQAKLCAKTVASKYNKKLGFIPAVFEAGNKSAIIPAIEGLVFPYMLGDDKAVSARGPYGAMIKALKLHLKHVLVPGVCIDPVSGGWKLSSTNNNTWASKTYLCQFVAETVLGFKFGAAAKKWDAVHAGWQCNEFAEFAFSDQLDSTNGKPIGSRYYPRGVTNILWLHGRR